MSERMSSSADAGSARTTERAAKQVANDPRRRPVHRRRGVTLAAAAVAAALSATVVPPAAHTSLVPQAQAQPAPNALPGGIDPKCEDRPNTSTVNGKPVTGNSNTYPFGTTSAVSTTAQARDAIDVDYVTSAADLAQAKSTVSGKVTLAGTGTMAPGTGEGLDGIKVYLQWQSANGAVSPVYSATTHSLKGDGKGVYAFDLREGFVDARGTYHQFTAADNQSYRVWVEPQRNQVSENWLYPVRFGNGVVPRWSGAGGDNRTTGAVQNRGVNVQRVDVRLTEIPFAQDAPQAGHRYYMHARNYSFNQFNAAGGNANSISGRVWLESGKDAEGKQTPVYDIPTGDKPAARYTVHLATLTPEGARKIAAIQEREQSASARAKAVRDAIVEAQERNEYWVGYNYNTVTEADGRYRIVKIEQPGRSFQDIVKYSYMWVEGPGGTVLQTHSGWMLPEFRPAWEVHNWSPRPLPQLNTSGGPSITDVHFAVTSSPPQATLNMFVENFDTEYRLAKPGETARLRIDGTLPPQGARVQWRLMTGRPLPVDGSGWRLTTCADINNATFEVPEDAQDGDVWVAQLIIGDEVIARDSFMVHTGQAATYTPFYEGVAPRGEQAPLGENKPAPGKQPQGTKNAGIDVSGKVFSDFPWFKSVTTGETQGLPPSVDGYAVAPLPEDRKVIFEKERGFAYDDISMVAGGRVVLPTVPWGQDGETLKVPVVVTYEDATRDVMFAEFETIRPPRDITIENPQEEPVTAVDYPVTYVRRGSSRASQKPAVTRTYGTNAVSHQPVPEGTTFRLAETPANPANPTTPKATVDKNTGAVTLEAPRDVTPGTKETVKLIAAVPGQGDVTTEATFVIEDLLAADRHTPGYESERKAVPGATITLKQEGDTDLPASAEFAFFAADNELNGWLITVNERTGTIRATAPADTEPPKSVTPTIHLTFDDGSARTLTPTISVATGPSEADGHAPAFAPVVAKRGQKLTLPGPADRAQGARFELIDGWALAAAIDEDSGAITATIPTDAQPGSTYSVRSQVTYRDGSTETVTASIEVDSIARTSTASWPRITVPRETVVTQKPETAAPAGTTYGVKSTFNAPGWFVGLDKATGELSVTTSADVKAGAEIAVPVVLTFPDDSQKEVTIALRAAPNRADVVQLTYSGVSVRPGESAELNLDAPPGTVFSLVREVEDLAVKIDPSTGRLKVTAVATATAATRNVEVEARYPDGSNKTIEAPVTIEPPAPLPDDGLSSKPAPESQATTPPSTTPRDTDAGDTDSQNPLKPKDPSSDQGMSKGARVGIGVALTVLIGVLGAAAFAVTNPQIRDMLASFGIRL